MTTTNKLVANQQNALNSTGPTTIAGRSKSSKNALRHGFYSAAVVVGESAAEFEALRAGVYDEFAPEGVMEGRLVDRVVLILWRFERMMRYEVAVAANAIGAREVPLPPDPERSPATRSMRADRPTTAHRRGRGWPTPAPG